MEGTTVSSAPADSGPRDLVRSAPTRGRRFRSLVQRPSTLGAVAVIAVAAPLRAVAVGFALPVLNHPDEPLNVRIGSDMSDQSDWNPHHFNYPSMLYDVVAIFVRIHGWATGQHGSGSARIHIQNIGIAATSEPGLFVALRLLTSVLSVAICLLAYVVVLRVTGRVLAALLAGLLLAVSPTVLTNGVLISPDTYSGVFSALALLGAVAVIRRGRPLDYAVAGIGVGLAAAAKYNAAAVAVAVIAAHLIRHRASWWRRPEILLSGAAAVGVFVLVTPAAILDFHSFVAGASAEARHYARGHPGLEGGSLWYYLVALRPDILLLAGAVLSVFCLRGPHRREIVAVLLFAISYGGLLSIENVHFARNLLPLAPALAMLAGFTAASWADQLGRRPRPVRTALAAGSGVVVAAGLAIAASSAAGVFQRLDEHPRREALQWLDAHVPARSRVVIEPYGPYIPPGRHRVTSPGLLVRGQQIPRDTVAVVVTELGSGRFLSQPDRYPTQVARYQALRSRYCLAGRWTDGPWVEVLTPCGPGHR